MKPNEYMMRLQSELIEKRNISPSTATQYITTLWILNGKRPFNNLAWTKKSDIVESIINAYAESTRLTKYAILVAALSTVATKPTYKAIHNYWKMKMDGKKTELSTVDPHAKTKTQEENWVEWEDVQKKKSELKEESSSFLLNRTLTASQFDKLQEYLLLSLYTDIPPRRNMDYLLCNVMKKPTDTELNYYDPEAKKFIFNKYKTAKKYGQQIVEATPELAAAIDAYLKHHPLAKSKTKSFRFLVKHDGTPLTHMNAITRILNRVFKKKVGSSMLRHIYVSSQLGDKINELKKVAADMGHSTDEQGGTYLKV